MKLEVINGSFSYEKGKTVLHDINMTVEEGEIAAVLGPNGIGKTTLLKCITGILRWTDGESILGGVPISKINIRKLWQQAAYVPQARATGIAYTGREMVLLGRSAHLGMLQTPGEKDVMLADRAFELLSIESLKDKKCSQMSGGELQMLMIARALAGEAKLLILDEPESGLDFRNQLVILEVLKKLSKEDGISCVFNTHYPAHALQIAEKTLMLGVGGRCLFGNSRDVVSEDNLRSFFGVNVCINAVTKDNTEYYSMVPISIA